MNTHYELLRGPFSTADAGYPVILLESGYLRIEYRDWQERVVKLSFHEVAAFSWDDADAAIDENHRDDCSYIVHHSPWLARHRQTGALAPSTGHQHYKLCFNAVGVLQVLATRLEVLPAPSTSDE